MHVIIIEEFLEIIVGVFSAADTMFFSDQDDGSSHSCATNATS
jgi:hypothetical protein